MNSSNNERWVCPNCGIPIFAGFCPQCGESPPHARQLTVRGLFRQLIQAFTSIDGRLVRSFRYLLSRPGFLTVAYVRGQRKPYIGPIPLFLLANVLFFATESLTGGKVFTTPLQSHLHTQPWSTLAEPLVSHRLETLKTTLDLFTPNFNRAVARNARSFIVLMALSFALPVWLVFGRRRLPFVAHAVFALHVYAFMLLLLCFATAIPPAHALFGGAGFASDSLDHVIAIASLAVGAIYLYVAIGAVYKGSAGLRVLRTVVLTVAIATIVLGYRFVLFLVTLYGA